MSDFLNGGQGFATGFNRWVNGASDVVAGGVGTAYNYVTGDDSAMVNRAAQYDHGQFEAGSGKAGMYDGIGEMGSAVGEGVSDFGSAVWRGIKSLGATSPNPCDPASGAGGAPPTSCGPADAGAPGGPAAETYAE
jgi:hypothetical protein